MSALNHDFRYLNNEGRWNGSTLTGLELRADGALVLAGLPQIDASAWADEAAPALEGELATGAAIAIAADGCAYYSRPDLHRVDRIDACTGETAPLPCFTGPGSDPGELRHPCGLCMLEPRRALLICDTGNARVQLVDPSTGDVREIWSWPLQRPVAIAADRDGNVYIVDARARSVFKRRAHGEWEPAFTQAVQGSALLRDPCSIAITEARDGQGERLYVLDRAHRCVFVFDDKGAALCDATGAPYVIGGDLLDAPQAVAATAHSLYISDRGEDGVRVLRFQASPSFGLLGAVPALASIGSMVGDGDRLWVQRGTRAPSAWHEQRAFVVEGALETPPIDLGKAVAWTSLHTHMAALPRGAHLELSVRFFDCLEDEGSVWEPAPLDALHLHLRNREARYCRVRVRLTGDGADTPVLENLSIRYDQRGYLAHLPAVYGAPGPTREFLVRFLALFESMNGELDALIDALPRLFDPASIPAEFLPWLASWLAVELDEHWPVAKQRAAIARAYAAHGRRGTAEGLRDVIAFELDLSTVLVEPIQQASWWVLPAGVEPCGARGAERTEDAGAGSLLGFTTSLAAGQADSAVVGSATLDSSRILHESDHGVPLFDDTAHQFLVHVYRGAADAPRTRAALKRLIEREKPAHTNYRLLAIEPTFRVGVQASVGFDSVVAGPLQPTPLGGADGALQLAGEPPARIGAHSHVGQGMRL